MRLSAFQGFVAPARLSAKCHLFASQQTFAGLVHAQTRTPLSRSLRTVTCMAAKKSVSDLKKADLEGKVVLVRADLNVPLDKSQNITDDTRIRAAIPTLKYLTDNGARVLLTSHLVRLCNMAHRQVEGSSHIVLACRADQKTVPKTSFV